MIPLKDARLCSDCDAVYHSKQTACPSCGSQAGWMLILWLNRVTRPE
jgi:RNA polymerase subunit RPABC4/transcription elongation factor Spt4